MKFTSEENKTFWNNYAKKSKDNPFGAHSDNDIVTLENNFIINELKSRTTKSLLDIGCGNGQRTLLFSKFVEEKVVGIDYSDQMINEAKSLLSDQTNSGKLSFKVADVQDLDNEFLFDVIISCRCFVNQTSNDAQVKLFESLYKKLNKNGSLIIAEQSMQGIENLNLLRKNFGLNQIQIAWHNIPIDENYVLTKIKKRFKIINLKRLGIYYYMSRVFHPALVSPEEPKPNTKINELGLKSELMSHEYKYQENYFEQFGAHLLIHFKKLEK